MTTDAQADQLGASIAAGLREAGYASEPYFVGVNPDDPDGLPIVGIGDPVHPLPHAVAWRIAEVAFGRSDLDVEPVCRACNLAAQTGVYDTGDRRARQSARDARTACRATERLVDNCGLTG